LVVYFTSYVPAEDEFKFIEPDVLIDKPVGDEVKVPPILPVILGIGFGSKVEQNELLG
jgi:hypothetical protein